MDARKLESTWLSGKRCTSQSTFRQRRWRTSPGCAAAASPSAWRASPGMRPLASVKGAPGGSRAPKCRPGWWHPGALAVQLHLCVLCLCRTERMRAKADQRGARAPQRPRALPPAWWGDWHQTPIDRQDPVRLVRWQWRRQSGADLFSGSLQCRTTAPSGQSLDPPCALECVAALPSTPEPLKWARVPQPERVVAPSQPGSARCPARPHERACAWLTARPARSAAAAAGHSGKRVWPHRPPSALNRLARQSATASLRQPLRGCSASRTRHRSSRTCRSTLPAWERTASR